MELTVDLQEPRALVQQQAHLEHGGLFVPLPDPPPPPLSPIGIRVLLPGGRAVELAGRAVQVVAGVGMALAFDDPDDARATLAVPIEDAVRSIAAAAENEALSEEGARTPASGAPNREQDDDDTGGTLHARIRTMSLADRRKLALQGDRTARMLLMKDSDKNIHTFVIQNPKITLDEVRYIAGFRQTHPDVLKRIAENRDWIQNPRIVTSIVCNPKTPTPVAVRLVDKLPMQELRRIAKNDAAPPAVVTVVKRKVTGS
jgi:hypothetical protein